MKAIVCFGLFFVFGFSALAQDAKFYRQLGLQLLEERKYEEALQSLLVYRNLKSEDNRILLKIAICSYYVDQMEEMERYLNSYRRSGGKKNKSYLVYYARLLRAKGQYQEAAIAYKKYLSTDLEPSTRRANAKIELKQCGLGVLLDHTSSIFDTKHAEEGINSASADIFPVASPNYENAFYFSSDRRGNMDIYQVESDTTAVQTLKSNINTGANEILLSFSCTGQWLYFKRDSVGVLVDSFSNAHTTTFPFPHLVTPTDSHFFCDSVLLFSSDQLEGWGGYDLYFCRKVEGEWSAPQNIGQPINSAYDERFPFLDIDGQTLYFSSNHPDRSIGKLDILKSIYNTAQENWSTPQNMGTKINSYANESSFSIQTKGTLGYFTSDHWLGEGGEDVYKVHIDNGAKRQRPYLLFDEVASKKQQKLIKNISTVQHESQLYYRIKIAERSTLEDNLIPANFPFPFIELDSTQQIYSYSFGRYQSFESAHEWYKEVTSSGWKDAELLVYLNDLLLDPSMIEHFKEQYEDLNYFWEYLQQP